MIKEKLDKLQKEIKFKRRVFVEGSFLVDNMGKKIDARSIDSPSFIETQKYGKQDYRCKGDQLESYFAYLAVSDNRWDSTTLYAPISEKMLTERLAGVFEKDDDGDNGYYLFLSLKDIKYLLPELRNTKSLREKFAMFKASLSGPTEADVYTMGKDVTPGCGFMSIPYYFPVQYFKSLK